MRLSAPSPTTVLPMVRVHTMLPLSPNLHLGEHDRIEEIADEEGGHRSQDDLPSRPEHAFIRRLPGPSFGYRQMDHGPFHQRHERKRSESGPDRAPGARIAVHFGQHVIDDVGDPGRTRFPPRTARRQCPANPERALFRADHVREQEHDHESDHDEVEVAEARAVQRSRLDVPQPLPSRCHRRRLARFRSASIAVS